MWLDEAVLRQMLLFAGFSDVLPWLMELLPVSSEHRRRRILPPG